MYEQYNEIKLQSINDLNKKFVKQKFPEPHSFKIYLLVNSILKIQE